MNLKPGISLSRKHLRMLTNRLVTSELIGDYKSVFRGRGLEFEGFRPYSPGDDASLIDWKSSHRAKQILIRQYQEERNLNVFFLIDASSSMLLGSKNKLKIEYVAELAASLGCAVAESGDSIGLALFTDRPVIFFPPQKRGEQNLNVLLDALVNQDFYGGEFDLKNALEYLTAILKEFSLVVIISDFITRSTGWQASLGIAARKFDVVGCMVRDPLDNTLPPIEGRVILGDPYYDSALLVEPKKIAEEYKEASAVQRQEFMEEFRGHGADIIELETSAPFIEPLISFFANRRKRMR